MGSPPKQATELTPELYTALLEALGQADTLVTLVIQGDSHRAIPAALQVARALSELQRRFRVKVPVR